jgi:aquaporin Z
MVNCSAAGTAPNTSVNPARSTGAVLFGGTALWLFWVAPLVGGALGGLVYRYLLGAAPGRAGR